MKAAILFTGKYGSTRQYAMWLGEATGLPVFDLRENPPEPWNYDLLILGTSIIVGKPSITRWMKKNWHMLWGRKLLLFSVSGTAPGNPDLQVWMQRHLGQEILSQVKYVPLRGRLDLDELPWLIRILLKLAARASKDPETKERMSEGFDYIDRGSLQPILEWYAEQLPPVEEEVTDAALVPA
jgi:menaquinone-dependent protoporphyrinogen IX oxidase